MASSSTSAASASAFDLAFFAASLSATERQKSDCVGMPYARAVVSCSSMTLLYSRSLKRGTVSPGRARIGGPNTTCTVGRPGTGSFCPYGMAA